MLYGSVTIYSSTMGKDHMMAGMLLFTVTNEASRAYNPGTGAINACTSPGIPRRKIPQSMDIFKDLI